MHVFELQELEDATEGFSPARLIGKGSHGSVYRGILRDGNLVAIKKQSPGLQDNSKPENEALILSSIHPSPCIITFLGISRDPGHNTIIVTEYMTRGTLHQLLHSSATPPPWQKRVDIALQIARALCCLHDSDPPIVHRDVKSANLLLDDSWNVKLADFGLATQLQTEAENRLPAGTIGYIDPSYTTPRKLSTKIDVFSYGVVLLELVSGRKAIDVSKSPASIVDWALPLIAAGRVMEVCDQRAHLSSLYTGRALGQVLGLAARCVMSEKSTRPSMNEVVSSLESLMIGPIHQVPWTMNYFREMVVCMMRGKKGRVIKTGSACAEDDDKGCNNISKGRLLVREILADITLK